MEKKSEGNNTEFDKELFLVLANVKTDYWKKLIGFKVYTKQYGQGIITEVTIDKNDGTIKLNVRFIIDGKIVDKLYTKDALYKSIYKLEGPADWMNTENLRTIHKQMLRSLESVRQGKRKIEDKLDDLLDREKHVKQLIKELREPYYNHCFKCNDEVTDELDRCYVCGWFRCKRCGSCGCNYWHHHRMKFNSREERYANRLKELVNDIGEANTKKDSTQEEESKITALINILKTRI